MADSVVIVAIPRQDDRVWKISSEKIPHMTLLYLGAMDEGPAFASIENFVKHVVTTTMTRFGASVTKRGTLGPDEADVLFFEKDYLKDVAAARQNMLANSELYSAFTSADQYPEWTPHLTLGYPVAPAKPDTADYPISWVEFDRVAIWFGDSVGPTFDLPPDHSNQLAYHTDEQRTEELMGSITRLSEDELAHFGVLGMKWGRRKEAVRESAVTVTSTPGKGITQISGGFNREPSHDAVKTKTTRQVARSSSLDAVSTKDLQELVNRMNLEQQYSRLTYTPSKFEKGRSVLKELLGAGQQANQAIQFANSPSGSYMKAAMKGDKAAMSEALKPPKKEKKTK